MWYQFNESTTLGFRMMWVPPIHDQIYRDTLLRYCDILEMFIYHLALIVWVVTIKSILCPLPTGPTQAALLCVVAGDPCHDSGWGCAENWLLPRWLGGHCRIQVRINVQFIPNPHRTILLHYNSMEKLYIVLVIHEIVSATVAVSSTAPPRITTPQAVHRSWSCPVLCLQVAGCPAVPRLPVHRGCDPA